MKTNVPEKIYIQLPSRNWIGRTWNETPMGEGDNPNWKNATNIEYTRTDTFIEKACEWLSKHAKKYYFNKDGHYLGTDELIEDFKLSMEL